MVHIVYILLCNDQKYYTGVTGNIKKRFSEHANGLVVSTKHRRPVQLLFFAGFPDRSIAAQFEKYLKSNSGRAFRNKHFLR